MTQHQQSATWNLLNNYQPPLTGIKNDVPKDFLMLWGMVLDILLQYKKKDMKV